MMEWVRGESIGHGSFGTVNLAIPMSQGIRIPQLMAVKSCAYLSSAQLLNEKSILDELRDCPEIIGCYGGDFSFQDGEELYNLFLEYASGGDLANKLKNLSNRHLPESDVRRYTKSILKGLQYIHKNGYVHCDMKLQNILLCSARDGSDDVAKIADFGLAKKPGENAGFQLRGTPLYMSPETVTAGDQEAPADVWALGCMVAEMVTGTPAWRCPAEANIFRLLMRIGVGEEVPEIPENLSAEGKDFLRKCFVKDTKKRWTAEMLLNHPFVADDHNTAELLEDRCEASPSTSPRCPFDWEFGQSSCSITSLSSPANPSESTTWSSHGPVSAPADRLRQLVSEKRPDWSVSDNWVTVR